MVDVFVVVETGEAGVGEAAAVFASTGGALKGPTAARQNASAAGRTSLFI